MTSGMKPAIVPIAALVILFCVLISGCTSDTGAAPATPAATPAPVTVATTAPVTVTTVPAVTHDDSVQQMPPAQDVTLALTKDRPTSEIHL